MSDFESIASTGLSIIALAVSVAAYLNGRGTENVPTSVLVYDPQYVASQIAPYVEAGQDPMAVIDVAVDEAVEAGFVVIDARVEVIAPHSAKLRLQDFVEVGQALPVQINSVQPQQPVVAGVQTPATSQQNSSLQDMARQLYGTQPVFTIPQEGQN